MFDCREAYDGFIAEFAACRVPKERWTHHAHLAVGLWYLERLGFEDALAAVRTASVGLANTDSSGYHETLTRLYLRVIVAHRARHRELALPEALRQLLASPLADSQWPLTYYSRGLLFSATARRAWVEPDLQAL